MKIASKKISQLIVSSLIFLKAVQDNKVIVFSKKKLKQNFITIQHLKK
jgi:hypothetical protein